MNWGLEIHMGFMDLSVKMISWDRQWSVHYGTDGQRGQDFLYHHVHSSSEAHPATYWMGTAALSPGIKLSRVAPSNAEVRTMWDFATIPPIHLQSTVLRKRDFTFLPLCVKMWREINNIMTHITMHSGKHPFLLAGSPFLFISFCYS